MKILALLLAATTLTACSDPTPTIDPGSSVGGRDVIAVKPDDREVAGDDATAAAMAAVNNPATSVGTVEAGYLGRWTGVEGMYLVVAEKSGGGVMLEMRWDLDHTGTFDGSVTAEGLRFMRNDVAQSAVHTNGEATGLKYLVDKTDCLTVKPGEGYCRD